MSFRVVGVDDYEPFRRVVRLILGLRDDLRIIGEASDGLEAVQKAKILQPDLVLLDIDLPTLNGIQVARRVRDNNPRAKIIFMSVESSSDIVQEAFNSGAIGYVHKLHAQVELLSAIETVIRDKQFIGSGVEDSLQQRVSPTAEFAKTNHLNSQPNPRHELEETLHNALELIGAQKGSIRLLNVERGVLTIEVQQGFNQDSSIFSERYLQMGAARAGERCAWGSK